MVQFDVKRVQKGVQSFMVSFDFNKTPITEIADYIIIAASKHGTSDIHFDPRDEGMMVRFRMDGDLQDYTFVPKAYERNLTTRLKLLANMNITESRLPQDGAIKGDYGGTYLDMRVSSLPTNEGEKIVIRILDYSRSLKGIETLGFHPDNLEKIKRMMHLPNGIILTTGATGSGKSTTTYSILSGLNKPETNIITVEDPIEMNIEGINQVQVNSEIGMTFAAALRSILRQDPNIVLIGEIRDSETAQIAVRTAITGHLVLSTIHTNNALSTVERLLDMNVERYLLSTAMSGIISQKLGKMICKDCRYERETTKYEKKVFKQIMHKDVDKIWDANPAGCEHCRKGYKGRIAFHEVLEIDDEIKNALNNPKISKEELKKLVYTGKTITMLQDALIKCLDGKTSFSEVYAAIEIELEDDDDDDYIEEMEEIKKDAPKEKVEEGTDDDSLEETKPKETNSNVNVNITIPELEAEKEQQNQEDAETPATVTQPPVQQQTPTQQVQNPSQPIAQPPVQQQTPTQQVQNPNQPVVQASPIPQVTTPLQIQNPSQPVAQASPIQTVTTTQPVQQPLPIPTVTENPRVQQPIQVMPQTIGMPVATETPLTPTVQVQQSTQVTPSIPSFSEFTTQPVTVTPPTLPTTTQPQQTTVKPVLPTNNVVSIPTVTTTTTLPQTIQRLGENQ